MGGGNEGCGELEGIWGFEVIMGSKESSPFGDLVGNGKDRKMGEVAKKDHIPGCQRHVLFSVRLDQTFRKNEVNNSKVFWIERLRAGGRRKGG
jgi:hypothetical protein